MFKCLKVVRIGSYVKGYFLAISSLGRLPSGLSEIKTQHQQLYQDQKFTHFGHLEMPVQNPMHCNLHYKCIKLEMGGG